MHLPTVFYKRKCWVVLGTAASLMLVGFVIWLVFILQENENDISISAFEIPSNTNAQTNQYENQQYFPKGFKFGSATSAYQIEGAWNKDGKGASTWDMATQYFPHLVTDESNGNIAANSYKFYQEDIKALKEIQVDFYRFSISWSRVLPNGDISSKNELGLKYYDNLIDNLIDNGIEPIVTMFHYDTPQALQNLGGWTNPLIVDYFEEYARLLFQRYGDRVKIWLTFNEPNNFCFSGYGDGTTAPLIRSNGIGEYLCAHYALLANARAYHLYKNAFSFQNGKIAIVLNIRYYYPKNESNEDDIEAANRAMQFASWFSYPIFSEIGDYPDMVRNAINENSKTEGFGKSRLPYFSDEEIELVKGSSDFFALNYYTSRYVEPIDNYSFPSPSFQNDRGVKETIDSSWPIETSTWLYCVPDGFKKLLKWIKTEYNNPTILITENGWPDNGEIEDDGRIHYLTSHLQVILDLIWTEGSNIIGYTYWSLIDNFEWMSGYTEKFGLFRVDFSSINKTRTARKSASIYTSIIKSRKIPEKNKANR